MKSLMTALCLFGLLTGFATAQDDPAEKPKPPTEAKQKGEKKEPKKESPYKTNKERVSYGLGFRIGSNISAGLAKDELEVDFDLLAKGLIDAFKKSESLLDEEDYRAAMEAYQKELRQAKSKKNAAFLAENGKKKGVVTTKSGLQYIVLKEGKGKSPKATDRVKTHYEGTLLNGTVFDSSYKRNEPTTFGVNQVIKGWSEALQLMKVGSKLKLFVPAELAYGERPPRQSAISPNSILIFEVELLEIIE